MDYPYENFNRDVRDLIDKVHAQSDGTLESTIPVCCEYMYKAYEDQDAAMSRTQRFVLIMHYLAQHTHDFDRGDYLVYGSNRAGVLANDHLLRAIHYFFTGSLSEMRDPTPEEVMALADSLKEK